jgi:GNAT superfamily N-acetyltransferase
VSSRQPAGIAFRAPAPGDLGAVGAVLVADELQDSGETTLGENFVRQEWSRATFDLATDGWVAVDDAGEVVGYAQVAVEEDDVVDSWGVVHPAHRGRGIGSALIDRIEARGPQLVAEPGTVRLRHSVNAGDAAAAAILDGRGFRPVHHFWHMQVDLLEPFDPGPAPEGIEIGGVDPTSELPAVHALLDQAFVDDLSHHPQPFDRWVEEETSSPDFDPALWLMARDGGKPAGVLTASAAEDRGWIDYLAVLAPYRGRGVAAALLRRSFSMFAGRGLGRALVSVDARNPTGATGVYERAGMRIVKRWDLWERPSGDQEGGAKNSSAMPSGSRKLTPDP